MSETPHPEQNPEETETLTPDPDLAEGDREHVDGGHTAAERGLGPQAQGEGQAHDPEPELEADDTITFKRSHFYAALVPLAFILGLGVGFLFWGRSGETRAVAAATAPGSGAESAAAAASSGQTAQGQAAAEAEGSETVRRYDVPVDDDPQLGPNDAPITIIEFSDYECPFCKRFHEETFFRLLDAYEGQIRFVYRDFPLASIHSNAIPAAEAANCAREQEAFWEFHDLLFGLSQGLSRDAYLSYARSLGLDEAAFEACLDSRRYQEEVEDDYNFAARLGVRSTPTFFINGLPLVGAQPFEVFQQVIDQELAGEIP